LTPEEIKKIRLDLGMSQAEFGECLSVTQATVCRWEIGFHKPSKMAVAFIINLKKTTPIKLL
jgi:DNA-binding transcriptional regulator YiaG